MVGTSLSELYEELLPPAKHPGSEIRFSARILPRFGRYHIAKDGEGLPALLCDLGGRGELAGPPIRLENLTVDYDVDCEIERGGAGAKRGKFIVIRCPSRRLDLHSFFLRACETLVGLLGSSPNSAAIAKAINGFVELFSALALPPRKTTQGLWAELFLIAQAASPKRLIEAWHSIPEERYDFVSADQRIEVKSSVGRVRKHHFSLEQLSPPKGAELIVASVLTERAGGGTALQELLDEVNSRVGREPALIAHAERVVALTLRSNLVAGLKERFDRQLAEDSLRFFDAKRVPSVPLGLPTGVTEVRFVSDLTGVSAEEIGPVKECGGLFAAAVPHIPNGI